MAPATKPKGKPGRPTSVEMYPGKYFGHLRIVRKVNTREGVRYDAICEAMPHGKKCGKQIRTRLTYLLRQPNPQVHCGCLTYVDVNPYPREKGIWHMMHMRTEDPKHVSYHYYGGRGIKVCDRWNKKNPNGWFNFINDMGGAPTTKHSIDRVNPNLGYQPYQEDGVTPQCRWATATEQANNKRSHWAKK